MIIDDAVEMTQKLYGVNILLAAIAVGDPFTLFSRIIKIDHGSNSIDPQTVYMVLVKPEKGVGNEEIADLFSAIIIN